MSETPTLSPWADPPAAPPAPAAVAAPDRWREIGWGAVSTLLLMAWIGWQMGWLWAVAAVFGVFVHEFGHVLVINWAGCGPSRIRIIPFFGGAATMTRTPDTAFKGVLIALAGPVFGLLATLPFFALAALGGGHGWLSGAFVVAAINLLNLAPAPPLDGSKALGPVLAQVHPALERVALVAVGLVAVVWGLSRGNLVLPAVIGFSVLTSLRMPIRRPVARPLTWGEWSAGLALYLGALALCAAVMLTALAGDGVSANFFAFGPGLGRL